MRGCWAGLVVGLLAVPVGAAEPDVAKLAQQVALTPSDPDAMVDLGVALGRGGQAVAGLTWLEHATRLGAVPRPELLDWLPAGDASARLLARAAANRRPVGPDHVVATLPDPQLQPESIALGPDGTLYAGSMWRRKVVAWKDGHARDFATEGLFTVIGIKVDAARGQLLANSCNLGKGMERPDPATVGQAALHRYDLATGRLIARYPAGSAQAPVCFNDLAIGPQGDVYLTGGPHGLWRVPRGATAVERFVAPDGRFFNGIDVSADGRTLYLADTFSGIATLDLATLRFGVVEAPADVTLAGIDGLYVRGRDVVAVQNGFASVPARVVQGRLDESGHRLTCLAVLEQGSPHHAQPTTGVLDGDRLLYVGASHIRDVDASGRPREGLPEAPVLAVPLRGSCDPRDVAEQELRELHEKEMRAHRETRTDLILENQPLTFLYVGAGKVDRISAAEMREFFTGYFKGAEYQEYRDLEEPTVRASEDGTTGWVITRLKAHRTQRKDDGTVAERAFTYAGIMIYEKRDGTWRAVANATTFE